LVNATLSGSDTWADLVGDGIDVALRIGSLSDSAAIARKVGVVFRTLAASPAYLANAGTPRVIQREALKQHFDERLWVCEMIRHYFAS
jgi:DNA-binding transcriptional LysR family regulator